MLVKRVFGNFLSRVQHQKRQLQQLEQNLKQNQYHYLMDQGLRHKYGTQVLNDYREAGQERYRGLTSNHFRKAVGALLVFDLTNKETFDKLKTWIETLKSQAENDIQILLVGNKLDLLQKNPESRKVKEDDAKQLAKTYRCKYVEISAQTSENVTICFETLLTDLCKMRNGFRGGEQSQLKLMKQSANLNEGKCKC